MATDDGWTEVKRLTHDFEAEKIFEGIFLSKQPGQYGGDDYIFERLSDKKHVYIYGQTALRSKMLDVSPGTLCRIEFLGPKKSPNNRTYNEYRVLTKELSPRVEDLEDVQ